jgi:hypothetical protein
MTRHCFAIACLSLTLAATAMAQESSLVHEATTLNFDDQAIDAAPASRLASLIQEPSLGEQNQWLLTDATIDAHAEEIVQSVEIGATSDLVNPASACSCGQGHCRGVCRDPGHPRKPLFTKPGDRDRGDCPPLRYRMDDCQRAGNPHCYHRWAKCSVDDKYSAWFVGGGSPFPTARARTASEGTWGLDYGGLFGHNKVWLNYSRGRKQGGEGAYRTDGEPKIVKRAHELLHLGHK